MKTLIATLALTLAATGILPAYAQQAPDAVITTADLDLAAPASGGILLQRIRAAAHKVCIAPGHAMQTSVAGCTRKLVGDTVKGLAIPVLTTAWKDGGPAFTQLASR